MFQSIVMIFLMFLVPHLVVSSDVVIGFQWILPHGYSILVSNCPHFVRENVTELNTPQNKEVNIGQRVWLSDGIDNDQCHFYEDRVMRCERNAHGKIIPEVISEVVNLDEFQAGIQRFIDTGRPGGIVASIYLKQLPVHIGGKYRNDALFVPYLSFKVERCVMKVGSITLFATGQITTEHAKIANHRIVHLPSLSFNLALSLFSWGVTYILYAGNIVYFLVCLVRLMWRFIKFLYSKVVTYISERRTFAMASSDPPAILGDDPPAYNGFVIAIDE